jgi:polysaccharide export outer membrane protein
LAVAAFGALAACDLPQGAAQSGKILREAEQPEATHAIQPVTRTTVGQIADWPGGGGPLTEGWITRTRGPAGNVIEAGDVVDITIWESGDTSLLAQPGQKVVSLPQTRVGTDGTVFIPYVEKIYIARMTPDEAREAIQEKLGPIVPAAQVLIAHTPGRKTSVDLVSGVANPGSFALPDRDFTVMAMIAVGGGVQSGLENPQVRLVRDGRLYGVSLDRLLKDPSLDTTLRGGDKVFLEAEERYFLALGAAGREAQVPFPQDRLTALDAMALVGGVNDARANPKGILVLRDYPASAVRSDGRGPARERMVFAIDLTSADGLFSAGEFAIHHRDVVLVTESPVTAAQTIFGLIGGAFGIANSASNLGE